MSEGLRLPRLGPGRHEKGEVWMRNAREAIRRLGLVVGILGALAGAYLSYRHVESFLHERDQYREFQRVMASPVVLATIEHLKTPISSKRYKSRDRSTGEEMTFTWTRKEPPSTEDVERIRDQRRSGLGMQEWVNSGGVRKIQFDLKGDVLGIEKDDNTTVVRATPPTFSSFLVALIFPPLGFLLPWGTAKTVTWIAAGFLRKD